MKFFCVFVLACVVVLQVADAGKGGKCGKYKGEMVKIAKELHAENQMPECTEKYKVVMDPMFDAETPEEKKDAMKNFHDHMKNMNDDERKEASECKEQVMKKIVEEMEEKPDKECMDRWMKPKGGKNKE